eukprot:m.195702 g.195702  ORF g.195702 m.195702 type:complete len:1632 (-) comp32581_c2_seq1:207-5102(-)
MSKKNQERSASPLFTQAVMTTGGEVDGMVMALIEAANDKNDGPRNAIMASIHLLGQKKPALVLSSCEVFLLRHKHPKLPMPHRVTILNVIEIILKDSIDDISPELALRLCNLATSEMTQKPEVVQDWQAAAAAVVVALGTVYGKIVLDDLHSRFHAGKLPHYYVIKTLGDFSVTNVFTAVPSLEDTLSKCLPMLGMIKVDNMKWAFVTTFSKMCDSISTYVANIDRAPDKSITISKFSVQMLSALEVMFKIWLQTKESKLRGAIVEAVGLMTHIITKEKLQLLLPELISGYLGLYKKFPVERLTITQGLGQILSAALSPEKDCQHIVAQHLDQILETLYPLVQEKPNYEEPAAVKAYNEVLRAFECICAGFSDRLISYLFIKLEQTNEDSRAGNLSILKHLVNAASGHMSDKRELIVSGLRPLLTEKSLKVRSALSTLIMAMAHHDYLRLEGGQVLVQFIIDQCALQDAPNSGGSGDSITPGQLRSMCDNALTLTSTTIPCMQQVLWPYLLEFIVPVQYSSALPVVTKCLGNLAEALREEDDEAYDIDYEVLVNIPRPQEIIARLIVVLGHPLERQIGLQILYFFEGMSPNLHDDLIDLWDEVIPKLIGYLEKNSKSEANWDQQAWEDLVLKLLSRSLDAVNEEDWVLLLGQYLGKQYELYTTDAKKKNMLSKCLGVVLRKSSNKVFIMDHLKLIFASVNHQNQIEREGCARGYGFTAYSHLDLVLERLRDIAKEDMIQKSSGFFGMIKDKSVLDIARIKASLMLCYGFVTLYARPTLITSRVEVNILASINPHFSNVKDTGVKENLIRCVDLIGKSLHPSHLKNDKFVLHRRGDLLTHMIDYMKSESPTSLNTEIRALAMDACTTLLVLEPKLPESELFELVEVATHCTLDLSGIDKENELMDQCLTSLKRLLATILRKDVSSSCLQSIMKHLSGWMEAKDGQQRAWMMECYRDLLEKYFKYLVDQSEEGDDQGTMDGFGKFVAKIVPRCTDPIESVRKEALRCVQYVLRIQLCYRGGLDNPDNLVEAITKLVERASKTESSQQFAVVNDLAKVLAKKIDGDDLLQLLEPLFEGLLDPEASSASGACVVVNGLFRARGGELGNEVPKMIDSLKEKVEAIDNERTQTGIYRAIRTLAAHHLGAVMKKLLTYDYPYTQFVTEIWHTLVTDDKLTPVIFDKLLQLLATSRPYDENKGGSRTPSLAVMKATAAMKEIMTVEESQKVIEANYSKICSSLIVRIGCTAGIQKDGKLDPNDDAISCFKVFVQASKSLFIETAMQEANGWETFSSQMDYSTGITVVAASICENVPVHVPSLVEELEPVLKQVYDSQRAVAAAVFAEFINQKCAGSFKLVNRLKNALLTKLVDPSHDVRMLVMRGLGNVASIPDEQMKKHSTTVLSAMMTGMDDRDDPNDFITLEAMRGLSKVLAKVEEESIRQILINISLRIRPCFEKDKGSVRAAAIRLFGNLASFGNGPSLAPFAEQIHGNLVSLLLHLTDVDEEVTEASKYALKLLGPLLGSEPIQKLLESELVEGKTLHFGDFINDLSKLLISEFGDKINFYAMNNVNFFKSEWSPVKASAALFTGYLLGNLSKKTRGAISKEHVCGELVRLLKDPAGEVREKAAKAISLLNKY